MTIGAGAAGSAASGRKRRIKGALCCASPRYGIAYAWSRSAAAKYNIQVIRHLKKTNSGACGEPRWIRRVDAHVRFRRPPLRTRWRKGSAPRGEYVQTPQELRDALTRSYQASDEGNGFDADQTSRALKL